MRASLSVTIAALVSLTTGACKKEDATADAIPEALRAYYGRGAQDLEHGTLGLQIKEDVLELSSMKIAIRAGKASGDDYQITEAEVLWDGSDKVPKKCKGTVKRQDAHLLLSLFEMDSDTPCESILEGEWRQWEEVSEFPEGMRGWYGYDHLGSAPAGHEIQATAVVDLDGNMVSLVKGLRFVDEDDRIFVLEAEHQSQTCRGTVSVEDDRLGGSLRETGEDGGYCTDLSGERWTVDPNLLPKGVIRNEGVEITIADGKATLKSTGQVPLTCEQRVVRTAQRAATDRGDDRIPVLSGVVVTLAEGLPEGDMGKCREAKSRLDGAACAQLGPYFCDPAMLEGLAEEQDDPHCPTHIVIGDMEMEGRRVALLPHRDPSYLVCFEMVSRFKDG